MDEIDVLNEVEVIPTRRQMRAHVYEVRLPVQPAGFSADEFRAALHDALAADPDLTLLGRGRRVETEEDEHAPFLGVAVDGPLAGLSPASDGLVYRVRAEFGPGRIDPIRINEIVDDNVQAELRIAGGHR